MRIKSYFAPSVQAAIALVHKEFGHHVTLITSHVASLENRHLGEYEVVFAVEETPQVPPEPEIAPVSADPPAFGELLHEAIVAPSPLQHDRPAKLEHIHTCLVELGLDPALVRSFMTVLRAVLPSVPEAVVVAPVPDPVPAPEPVVIAELPAVGQPEPTPLPMPAPVPFLSLFTAQQQQPSTPRFSAAELAFMSCVSAPREQGA